jgi:hypothetical protein
MRISKLLAGVAVAAGVLLTGAFAGSAMAAGKGGGGGRALAPGQLNTSPGQQFRNTPGALSPGQQYNLNRSGAGLSATGGTTASPPGKTFDNPGRLR